MSVEQITNNTENAIKAMKAQTQALQQMYNDASNQTLQLRTQLVYLTEELKEANNKYAELEKKYNELNKAEVDNAANS